MEDRRSVGASSCNYGDGTDQRIQSLMLMMMMMMMMMTIMTTVRYGTLHLVLCWVARDFCIIHTRRNVITNINHKMPSIKYLHFAVRAMHAWTSFLGSYPFGLKDSLRVASPCAETCSRLSLSLHRAFRRVI